jgi:flagellar FliL protein
MATAPAAEKTEAVAPKKKGKTKLLVLIVVIGVVLGGGAFGALTVMGSSKKEEKKAELAQADEKKDLGSEKTKRIVTLKPIIVNVRDTRLTRYLKVSIGLEANSDAVVLEINTLLYPVNDFLVDRLSSVRIEELDNTAGRNKLKRELMYGLNELLESGVVTNLYFSEFIVQ